MPDAWALISGEIVPGTGGVADYTVQLAAGLAGAGDEVHVWAPGSPHSSIDPLERARVRWHPLASGFDRRGRRQLERELRALRPFPRLLLQYVPHAFGYRAMNMPLCRWFARQREHRPWVMFHEVVFPREAGQSWRHRLLATVTWAMAANLQRAAARSFVSIPAWSNLLAEIVPSAPPAVWLPVPSNLSTEVAFAEVAAARARLLGGTDAQAGSGGGDSGSAEIVGWFGGRLDAYASGVLMQTIPRLLRGHPHRTALLAGAAGAELRSLLLAVDSSLQERLHAPGALPAESLSPYLAAADLMLQPYPDGVSSRRGSAMAGLGLGRAILTTSGSLTEPLWSESGAVALVPASEPRALADAAEALLGDTVRRTMLGVAASELYRKRFALEHTVRALRQAAFESAERGRL